MRIDFHGVRGSIPAPGPETNRYGGNTSCVTIRTAAGELFIIDMGTGLVSLGKQLLDGPFGKGQGRAVMLLSHSHWDHIQGFPFFPPVFIPGNQFSLYGHAKSSSMLESILEGQMNPHFSPIYTLKNLGARVEFHSALPGQPFECGGAQVSTAINPHGSTTSLAFRIEVDGVAFVYASDVGYPDEGPSAEALALYRDADALLHDCTYTPADQKTRRNRGFSSYADAAAAAVAANVRRLIMFHYDQDYSDDAVDLCRDRCRAELDRLGGAHIELIAAAEGAFLEI